MLMTMKDTRGYPIEEHLISGVWRTAPYNKILRNQSLWSHLQEEHYYWLLGRSERMLLVVSMRILEVIDR